MMNPPDAPPPVSELVGSALEKKRAEDFAALRAALEVSRGCITKAAAALGWSREKGNALTRRFKLAEWARSLRVAANGVAVGRPPGSLGKRKRKAMTP